MSVSVTCSVTTLSEVVVEVENEVSVLVPIVLESDKVTEVTVSVDELLLDSCETEDTTVVVVEMLVRVFVVVPAGLPATVFVVQMVPVTETGFTTVEVVEASEVDDVGEPVSDTVVVLLEVESTIVVLIVVLVVVVLRTSGIGGSVSVFVSSVFVSSSP